MPTYQAYRDFSAQSHNVAALMRLYAQLERVPDDAPPLTAIIVFAAFAIEAYVNSVGARRIDFWDEIERLPWRKKLVILHSHARATADWGKDPLQFAVDVFQIRDKLAHGKPETVLGRGCSDSAEADQLLSSVDLTPAWLRALNRDWVVASKPRFSSLMGYLAGLYGLDESDYLLLSSGGIKISA